MQVHKERDLTDDVLIQEVLAGDVEAFGVLTERYRQNVQNVAWRILKDEALVQDAVQDAFLKALVALSTFRGDAQFSTWLYRIATNTAYDTARKRRKALLREGAMPRHSPVYEVTPELEVELREILGKIERKIGRMGAHHREVLLLRLVEGLKYDEIAERLDVPLGTVMSRLHYTRENLRGCLEM